MRTLRCLLGLSLLAASPAAADPPDRGFIGAIVYEDGREPPRFACDTLDLVKRIYAVGKDNLFLMHPKYEELATEKGVYGDAQCTVSRYAEVKVI
jgi:hypothetical protein